MVSTATTAFQVERSVDSTTQDVGFTGAGLVNTAAVDAFCNAAVGGVISRNCLISRIYDQSGNGCPIYNATAANMPDYMVDPGHQGLPRFQKVYQGSGTVFNFLARQNGGEQGPPTHPCAALTGPAQSLFFAGNSSYAAFSSGQNGLMENTVAAGRRARCSPRSPGRRAYLLPITAAKGANCGGMDTEAQGPQDELHAHQPMTMSSTSPRRQQAEPDLRTSI